MFKAKHSKMTTVIIHFWNCLISSSWISSILMNIEETSLILQPLSFSGELILVRFKVRWYMNSWPWKSSHEDTIEDNWASAQSSLQLQPFHWNPASEYFCAVTAPNQARCASTAKNVQPIPQLGGFLWWGVSSDHGWSNLPECKFQDHNTSLHNRQRIVDIPLSPWRSGVTHRGFSFIKSLHSKSFSDLSFGSSYYRDNVAHSRHLHKRAREMDWYIYIYVYSNVLRIYLHIYIYIYIFTHFSTARTVWLKRPTADLCKLKFRPNLCQQNKRPSILGGDTVVRGSKGSPDVHRAKSWKDVVRCSMMPEHFLNLWSFSDAND